MTTMSPRTLLTPGTPRTRSLAVPVVPPAEAEQAWDDCPKARYRRSDAYRSPDFNLCNR
jgi:hypothetical protein